MGKKCQSVFKSRLGRFIGRSHADCKLKTHQLYFENLLEVQACFIAMTTKVISQSHLKENKNNQNLFLMFD